MNVGSLFSGIGGIELGFQREGFEASWFVENNPYCQEVLRKHWPTAKIYGDIASLNFESLERVNILTGGFPCQDISVAGKQAGTEGKRSSLWKYYAEAIGILRPQIAVVENVPALSYIGLDVVLADIAQAGYDAEWFTLRASDFGAPHKRERLFIIAYSNPLGQPGKAKNNECLRDAERDIQDKNRGRIDQHGPAQDADALHPAGGRAYKTADRMSHALFVTDDCGHRIQRFSVESLQGEQGFSRFKDVGSIKELFDRPDIPQPLIRRGGDGVSRRLDTYLQKERTQAIGNAVVPQVAQFIARRIKEVLKQKVI